MRGGQNIACTLISYKLPLFERRDGMKGRGLSCCSTKSCDIQTLSVHLLADVKTNKMRDDIVYDKKGLPLDFKA